MPSTSEHPRAKLLSRRWTWAAAVFAMCSALAAVYGIAALQGNPAAAKSCASARALTPKLAPLTRGEVAAVAAAKDPRPAPALAFQDAQGTAKQVEDFRGRTILLNLWATWCAPCRQEMPALDELQAKLGGPDFEVVTINIDTRDPEKPKAWWRDAGIRHLAYYTDHSAKVFQELKAAGKAFGMPTTLLIDAQGCELATLAGPAEWASPEAIRLIEAALGRGS